MQLTLAPTRATLSGTSGKVRSAALRQQHGLRGWLGGTQLVSPQRQQVGAPRRVLRGKTAYQAASTSTSSEHELVTSSDVVQEATSNAPVVLVDWAAGWCRKCKYLAPKLQKLIAEEFPDVPLLIVDVNAMPGDVIKAAGVTKMPTLQLYKAGKKTAEVIGAATPAEVVEEVKDMLKKYVQA